MSVYKKLNEARTKFHELKLTKTGENTFAHYKYFELGDFLIPALKVFSEVGLCAVVSFDSDKACMLIRDVDKPEEFISIYSPMGSAALKGCHEVQNIGAVETYQRRYLWVAALEIVEHDALDATTGKDKPVSKTVADATDKASRSSASGPVAVAEDRQTMISLAASIAANKFKSGEKDAAYDVVEEYLKDNEEHLYLHQLLQPHSAFRAYIKFRREKAAQRATQTEEATT